MKQEPKYGFIRIFQRATCVALFLAFLVAPFSPIVASVAEAGWQDQCSNIEGLQFAPPSGMTKIGSECYAIPGQPCPAGMECLFLERTNSYGPLNPGYGVGVRSVGETANQLCIEHGYQSYITAPGYWAKYEWASPRDNYQRDYVNGQWTTYGASGGNDEIWTRLTCQRPASAPPSNAPTISWTLTPASAVCGAQYEVRVAAHDSDGDMIAVSVDKDGQPFGYADGGDGTNGTSGNITTDQGPKTVTFTAWAEDAAGNRSQTITHTVEIGACAPAGAPVGHLDGASCSVFGGWGYDPDTLSTPISVHFYADGPAGSGTFLGGMTSNHWRPDLEAIGYPNHAFSFATPESLKDGQPHEIYGYAINTDGTHDNNTLLSGAPKTITCQPPAPVNVAPAAPTVTGPTTGGIGSHTFTATATDANGDNIAYGFDWDNNGIVDAYTSYVPSGTPATLANTWSAAGTYTFRVIARDASSAVSDATTHTITITVGGGSGGNTAPNAATIQGPATGTVGVANSFTVTATDPQGDAIQYGFDWDNDGTVDEWTAETISGVSASRSHTWTAPGTYTVAVFVRDSSGATSAAATHTITIGGGGTPNAAPAAPTVTGPTTGGVGSHAFTAVSTDPNGDTVSYGFDWDNNGTIDAYTGFVTSGTPATLANTWSAAGTYTFRVIARDPSSAVSDATTHTITITSGGGSGGNTAPNQPLIQGPVTGTTDVANSFTATATDPEGNQIRYGFDWDNNGTIDEWTGFVDSGVSAALTHAYSVAGTYTVGVVAEDSSSAQSSKATHIIMISGSTGGSNAPVISSVTGPATGDVNVSYTFTATATDPQGDQIQYGFDWDNNGAVGSDSAEAWSSLVPSGTPASRSMSWPTSGAKAFQVFARDANGNVSSAFAGSIAISGTSSASFSFSLPADSFTSENGGTASFTVVLGSAPMADVTIPVMSSDFTEATTSVTSLVFTPANWNVPQTVTVTGVDDNIVDGNVAYTVNLGPSSSSAIAYNNLPAQSVPLVNMDNDTDGGGGTTTPPRSGGGGGRSGGPCIGYGCSTGGGSTDGDVIIIIDQPTTGGTVAGTTFTPPTRKYCPVEEFLVSYLKTGIENNPNEVKKLQYYLNTYENAGLEVDGFFGASTEAAVKAYQAKYADEILAPWGTNVPTGIVYITTSAHINRIFCGDNPWYTGTDDLKDILNPVLYPEVDNSSDFEGDIGGTATSSNMAGLFGAITQDILDLLKDIPWYPLLIVLLLILGTVFIGQAIIKSDMNTPDGKASATRGVVILLIATVLNVLNTMSFMINPAWLQDSLNMGSQWVLGLNLVNLAAIIVLCAVYLVSNRSQDGK